MEEEHKKRKFPAWLFLIIRLFEIIIVLFAILFIAMLIHAGYFSYSLTGNIRVTVNGELVEPTNIVCHKSNGDKEEEKLKLHWKEEYYYVKAKATAKDMYKFEFDIETVDGTKHFKFGVFKEQSGLHNTDFNYSLRLNKEDGEWVAYVSFGGDEERILLKDDPNAYTYVWP